jgi:hypothetical protein
MLRTGHRQTSCQRKLPGLVFRVATPWRRTRATFAGKRTGTPLPPAAECYSCHAAHAAVDTTFVQFYPTLLPIATHRGTLSPGYMADEAGRQK